jgi:hypothetical protein
MQQTPNPFGSPFPGIPLPGLDHAAIMQLSQMLSGSAAYSALQQNPKQQLDAALLHQQLQQASELQKPSNLPPFPNNNRGGRFNNGPAQPSAQNDANSDRKRVSPKLIRLNQFFRFRVTPTHFSSASSARRMSTAQSCPAIFVSLKASD